MTDMNTIFVILVSLYLLVWLDLGLSLNPTCAYAAQVLLRYVLCVSNCMLMSMKDGRTGAGDLRSKIQRKIVQRETQSLGLSSAIYLKALDNALGKPKRKNEGRPPARIRSVLVKAPLPETKKIPSTVSKKQNQQKVSPILFYSLLVNVHVFDQ